MVGQLVSYMFTSLDGYIEDADGRFDWSAPDEEVHAYVNDLEREVGTHLYGRRMYEVMVAWETMEDDEPVMRDYTQIWRAADKVVYSTTLQEVSSARTRIERSFDPDAVRAIKDRGDCVIGGAALAGEAMRHGLVDEVQLLLSPVIVGGGTRALPDGLRIDLELADQRRFENGAVHLAYDVQS